MEKVAMMGKSESPLPLLRHFRMRERLHPKLMVAVTPRQVQKLSPALSLVSLVELLLGPSR
jgi:hypothetical protein